MVAKVTFWRRNKLAIRYMSWGSFYFYLKHHFSVQNRVLLAACVGVYQLVTCGYTLNKPALADASAALPPDELGSAQGLAKV